MHNARQLSYELSKIFCHCIRDMQFIKFLVRWFEFQITEVLGIQPVHVDVKA